MVWDIFCRVIDNFGDVGVCWRLAAGLARRGVAVRLWIDDARALAWLAPGGAAGVQVIDWAQPAPDLAPGAVVIEAFGCAPPPGFVARMALARPAPVWINLEYLSAEPYVERSHGLLSPQFSGPGAGLKKWFFYPGFTPATGGLLASAHPDSQADARARARARARTWALDQGWGAPPGTRAVSVFCYPNGALPALLHALAGPPTVLRVPPGPVLAQLQALTLPAGMRMLALPYLCQTDFDQLLASADFNLVRGEDSFAQAQLGASAPFLWQIYPQHDGAHAPKLDAFLDLYLRASPTGLADAVRAAFRAFNGLCAWPAALPDCTGWLALQRRWRQCLGSQTDLCSQLIGFVDQKRG